MRIFVESKVIRWEKLFAFGSHVKIILRKKNYLPKDARESVASKRRRLERPAQMEPIGSMHDAWLDHQVLILQRQDVAANLQTALTHYNDVPTNETFLIWHRYNILRN